MAKRILKTLTNNIGFKLLAFALAFLLWLVVYNTEDPVKTRVFTTTVSLENSDMVTQERNKWFDIVNGTNQVSFSVSAKRSILEKLDDTDFTAVADFKNLVVSEDGSKGTVRIDIAYTKSMYGNSISINKKNKFLEVALEEFMKQQYKVVPNTTGDLAEGYALGALAVTEGQLITVSGPESIVSQIDKIVATINVTGMYEEVTDNNVIPVLLDKDGKEIATTRLELSEESVSVYAQILGTKELPLAFTTVGTPAEDSVVDTVTSSKATVLVKGNTSALNKLSSIEITGDVLDVEGASADISKEIDITEFLPDGISLVNAEDATIDLTIKIKTMVKRTMSINTDNIEVLGLGDEYKLQYESGIFTVVVEGEKGDVSALSAGQITGQIDVSGLAVGTHTVTVSVALDESKYKWDSVSVKITISDKTSDDVSNQDDNAGNNNAGNNNAGNNGTGSDSTGNNSDNSSPADNPDEASGEESDEA